MQCASHRTDVVIRDENAGGAEHFVRGGVAERHHRCPAGHRLQCREAETLGATGHDHGGRLLIEVDESCLVDMSGELDEVRARRLRDQVVHLLLVPRRDPAGDDEPPGHTRVGKLADHGEG